jgi:hypothetical protein
MDRPAAYGASLVDRPAAQVQLALEVNTINNGSRIFQLIIDRWQESVSRALIHFLPAPGERDGAQEN